MINLNLNPRFVPVGPAQWVKVLAAKSDSLSSILNPDGGRKEPTVIDCLLINK
jgi:hypothetical protein